MTRSCATIPASATSESDESPETLTCSGARICHAKGAGSRAGLLATALYAASWRAGGLDPFYGFYE